jgi:ribosomal protein S11
MDNQHAWRTYAAAALTGMIRHKYSYEETINAALKLADTMLAEEKKRFPVATMTVSIDGIAHEVKVAIDPLAGSPDGVAS